MSSQSILKNNIDKINTFNDLYIVTKDLKNKEKGDLFEELTKYIFLYHHNYKTFTKNVWLFNDIPQSLLKKLNMPNKDQGIDLVLLDCYGKYHAIQCKFRSDINEIIPWTTISTFYGLTFGVATGFSGGFYVTNTTDVTNNAKKSKNIIPMYGDFFENIPSSFFEELKSILLSKSYKSNPLKARDYQSLIIKETVKHFKTNDRGYLSMICGSGKTLTSCFIDDAMKNKITIATVPSLYLLSQFANDWNKQKSLENNKCNFILVGSDADIDEMKYDNNGLIVTTDPETIFNNISVIKKKNTNSKIIIITTYQSSNKLIEALIKLKIIPDLCIFDEAHKTVGQLGKQFNLLLDDKNIKIKKRLFMTATPKMYSGTIDNEKVLSMDDEKWYGKQICSYNASDAIKDGHLCDYKIISMLTNDEYIEKVINENKNLLHDRKIIKSQYISAAIMLLNSFKNQDCHHMITYHNTIASSKQFKSLLDKVSEIYKLEISIFQIDGKHTMKERNKIIKEFTESDMGILVSAKVLNEGINIPIVDAISFIDYRSSTIDIIQCVGRALRPHDKKKL
ncbi:MAG: DEAD/DEAH box helicase family protein, partial [Nitrososphaeraceae archaeon]|nr:DEAD/DEAH box helicase family protein [Nitrososphaeraceae archaeon]